ncbi:hypothetical protein P7K49_004902 [Saguinus oedipus]|uniref:Uncharacterized protein n=1 Tax=Saguinus oedipus TaxID=9490 RepID=A0ABQ9W957_SAGOE|nr:hypothetical protein P7K49_004902 [Saguinus oedipus]
MEVCLVEELPPTTELEEGLRNGVYLAKLAKFFAPKMVSEKKIYDVEQTRYKAGKMALMEVSLRAVCGLVLFSSWNIVYLEYRSVPPDQLLALKAVASPQLKQD